MRTIILAAILALPTAAQALTLADLTPQTVTYSIPDNTPKKAAWLALYCPGNRWVVIDSGTEIVCVEVDMTETGTTRAVTP